LVNENVKEQNFLPVFIPSIKTKQWEYYDTAYLESPCATDAPNTNSENLKTSLEHRKHAA